MNASPAVAAARDDGEIIFRWTQPLPVTESSFEDRVVSARRRTLEKIAKKHVCDHRQPWDRILPRPLLERLTAPAAAPGDERDATLVELAGYIRDVAVEAATRPLLLRCQSQPGEGRRRIRASILHVGRCGAYVAVDAGVVPGRGREPLDLLKTCFFATPHPADVPPGNAWRTMAQRLVFRWSEYDPRFGAFRVVPDDLVRVVPQRDAPPMLRWQPRFISEERWGIRELADGSTGFRSLTPGKW